jgi:aminomethyltransferase
MAPFAGFDMPIQYPTGAIEEHHITRRSVGLFDIDHMGQVSVRGSGADEWLSGLVSSDILSMKNGDAKYALLLNDAGGVIDDLFIYRFPGEWFVVVNAGNRDADAAWFASHMVPGVDLEDVSDATYMIAVQGPKAISLVDAVSGGAAGGLVRFTAGTAAIAGVPCRIGRTGYTGEDGVEVFFPADKAVELWDFLLAEGSRLGIETAPIGLAARDSLRFEAGMPLHGHEITPAINPIEAGFKWACDFSKDFVGKAALERIVQAGSARKLATIEVTGGVPREGYEVQDGAGNRIGEAVCGMFCPTVHKYACNAYVDAAMAKPGTAVAVSIRGVPKPGSTVKRPLYLPTYRR